MSRRKWITATVAVAATAAIVGVLHWWKDYPAHHFAVVQSGVLYRSGQPGPAELARLRSKFGIRTVINLRAGEKEMTRQEWYRREADYCRANGIAMFDVTIDPKDGTLDGLRRAMAVVSDHSRQPVLVHCEAGSVRTGFVVAAYRIVMESWPYEKAMAEAVRFQFNPDREGRLKFEQVLHALADGKLKLTLPETAPLPQKPATGPAH